MQPQTVTLTIAIGEPIGRKLVYRKVADQASGTQKILWIEQPQVIR